MKFTSPPPTPNVSTSFANMPHKAIVKQATTEGVRLVGRGGRGSKPRKARDTGGENGNVTSTDLEPRETLPLQPAAPIISSTSATVPTIITTLTHPLSPSLKSPPTSPVSSSFPKSSKRPAPLSRVPGPATPVAPPLLSPSIASSSKSSTKPEVIRYSGRGGAGSKPRKVKEKVKPLEEEQTKPISKGIPTIKTSIKFSWKGKGKIKLPQRSDFIPSSLQAVGDVDETSFDDSSSIQSSIHFGGIPPILNTQAIPHWPQSYDRNMPFASDVHEKRRKPSQFGMGKLARLLGTTSIPIQRQSSISSFSPSFATVSEDIHTDGLQRSSHASSRISYQNSNRSSGWGGEDLHKFDLNLDDDISIEERQKRRSTQTATSVSPIMFSDRPPAELLANQDTDHSISEEALSAHDFIQSSRHEGSPRYSDSSSQSSQPTTPHNAIPLHHPSSSTPSIMGSSSMVETPMSKPLSRRQIYSPSSMPTIIPKSPIDGPFGAYGAHLHPTGHQTPAFKFDLQEPQLYSGGHAYDLDYASDQNMDAETETISDLSSDCHIEFAKEHDAEPHPYRDLGAMAQKASKLDRRRSNADWSGQWNRDNMQDVISTLRSLR